MTRSAGDNYKHIRTKMRTSIRYIIAVYLVVLFAQCNKSSSETASNAAGAGGSTARFTIAGNYLYVVNNTSLKAFDISNTAVAPVLKSTTHIGISIETIFPYGDKLFIGSSSFMYIYSLANPERPEQLARAEYRIR